MEKVGSPCTLFLFEVEDHGFLNKKGFIDKNLKEVAKFLTDLGYLNSK